MKKINKHGLKMLGLKKAAGETKYLTPYDRGNYLQISYDLADGEILTDYHTQNEWSVYHRKSIITVCNTMSPMTMQEIADAIKWACDWR